MAQRTSYAVALAQSLLLSIICIAQSSNPAEKTTFQDLLSRAQHGDAASQIKLANAYLGRTIQTGVKVQPNSEEAVRWFVAAAEQNNVEALLQLAEGYESGYFGAKDGMKAAEYYRRAAELGNRAAAWSLAHLYTEGAERLPRNFDEAARWANCPKPSTTSMENCRQVTLDHLPKPALALLRRLKCDAGPNYDSGTELQLSVNSDSANYEVCCHDAPHGPCSAVLIGEVGGIWTDLTNHYGLLGFETTCGGLMVLESAHAGMRDLCLPTQCSTPYHNRCQPEILEFSKDGYGPISSSPTSRPDQ